MLHKRTSEAVQLFKEGVHAAYFGDVDEMIEKIKYYLANTAARERIQKSGYLECHRCHSMDNRVQQILSTIENDIAQG